ncbi:TlpA family protein disulfide reductase [Aggregicoccus sp. 17bor-14]|uniref:peroxiredoxin family protein n=1 Tax=Myxococcaceae TaxID=31 RepID=UPI00129D1868|nr:MULTISPECIES: TlpA disulfide reductase family protein [Myxococcaceae]MBF5040845.1 TlpA family protein disulfide reductase [Simulacricoccus sp. 17bor-14]MRI86634.1 TlpA family protein disulfide reductase [Aggregicoccus sp. 17bor-14]
MRAQAWVGMAAALLLGAAHARAQEPLPAEGRPAPAFRLPVYNADAAGAGVVGLERYVGPEAQDKDTRLVLLSFMASFCQPCKKELPYLQSLHARYREQGLRVVMVSIDSEPSGQKLMDELLREHHVTFPVLKDRFNLVARRWLGQQSPLPSLFLVRPDGTVLRVHRGYDEKTSRLLAEEVAAALGSARPVAAGTAP